MLAISGELRKKHRQRESNGKKKPLAFKLALAVWGKRKP